MKNNNIARVRVLYGLFAGILLICLGLFVCNVISAEDRPQMADLMSPNKGVTFAITDLHSSAPLYLQEQPVDGTPAHVTAHAHINRFDVDINTQDVDNLPDSRLIWVLVLQVFEVLSLVAVLVLVVIALWSFYRSAKHGRVFPARNVSLLMAIGFLLLAMSLSMDTSTYLERRVAYDLLQGTQWVPEAHYTLHFIRIFFGMTIIFLAQIIKIGREMQEEQELTI